MLFALVLPFGLAVKYIDDVKRESTTRDKIQMGFESLVYWLFVSMVWFGCWVFLVAFLMLVLGVHF